MIKRNFHRLLLAALLLGAMSAMAQPEPPPPLPGGGVLEPIGGGFSPERQLQIKVKNGPFEAAIGKFTLPVPGELDWHDHPGSGVIMVLEGEFVEFKENGCVAFHGPGSVFFENQGEVHRIANVGAVPAVGMITFFVPVGAFPVTFVAPPKAHTCPPAGKAPDEEEPSLEDVQAKVAANAEAIQKVYDLLNNLTRTLPFRR